MPSAVQELVALVDESDPWVHAPEELAQTQLRALNERFAERRGQVKALNRRALDEGVDRVGCLADLVPLMFSHTTYKSYPDSFLERGRWGLLTQWLGALSTLPVDNVRHEGIEDVDGWVARLHEAGHLVFASSGTTGHCSFLNQTTGDRAFRTRALQSSLRVMTGMSPKNDRVVFLSGPKLGFTSVQEYQNIVVATMARPGGAFFLFDGGATVHELNRMAALRRALAAGVASPDDIAAAREQTARSQADMGAAIERFADALIAHRQEPAFIMGLYSMQYAAVEAMRAGGQTRAGLHPDTILQVGGGLKGAQGLPADFVTQVKTFYGLPERNFVQGYGMGEASSTFPACAYGRYHVPPWIVVLILDKAGERLVEPVDGVIEGRAALFDVSIEARWAGVISGDKLTIDTRPCPCGRKSATVTSIARYVDLPEGDDKLTCAGTVDSYVRGLAGEPT